MEHGFTGEGERLTDPTQQAVSQQRRREHQQHTWRQNTSLGGRGGERDVMRLSLVQIRHGAPPLTYLGLGAVSGRSVPLQWAQVTIT